MDRYFASVMTISFLVDFLLLIGADRLCGYPVKIGRCVAASAVGGVYAGACLLPGFYFLGNILWRMVCLLAMAVIVYGLSVSAMRRGLVFAILSLALGGIVNGMGQRGTWGIACTALVLCGLCYVGFPDRVGSTKYLPVELNYGGKCVHLTALLDTGNTLRDPVTGADVLVVGADIAQQLLGLSRDQLVRPVESLGKIPGLRLIPYKSIGNSGGFLLAIRLADVKIGKRRGYSVVAFAPDGLSEEGAYQALTGGAL